MADVRRPDRRGGRLHRLHGPLPTGHFDFNVGVLRWTWRVQFYAFTLGTDVYPPFTLHDVADYPARLDVEYPERLSRGLVWVKWWLLAIPQYLVVAVFTGGAGPRYGGGLIGILCLIAGVTLAVTRRYPRPDLRLRHGALPLVLEGYRVRRAHAGRVPAVPARHRTGRTSAHRGHPSIGGADAGSRDLVMADFLITALFITHGLVHLAIYAAPASPGKPAPFDPGHSWALGGVTTASARSASVALACAVAAAYSAAGLMVAIEAPNAAAGAGLAAALGLLLKGLWFHPWLTLGVALDIAVAVAAVQGWPA